MVGEYISRDYLLDKYDRQHQGPPGGLREPCQYENCVLCQQAADAIEELSKPRWIPVTEGLPDGDAWDRVLVYTDEGNIQTAPKCKVGNGWITHWMPLPEPPKEEA